MISNPLVLLIPAISVAALAVKEPACFHLIVPVHVDSQSYPLLLPILKNGYEATELVLQATKRDGKWLLESSRKNNGNLRTVYILTYKSAPPLTQKQQIPIQAYSLASQSILAPPSRLLRRIAHLPSNRPRAQPCNCFHMVSDLIVLTGI